MAKISNTGSYPLGVPADDDYIIGTEALTLETKNYKLGDIAGLDPADTLSAVLTAGDEADCPLIGTGKSSLILKNAGVTELQLNPQVGPGVPGNGDIIAAGYVTVGGYFSLVGQFQSPAGIDLDIVSLGVNDDITISAGATSGRVMMSGAGIAGNAEDIEFTASVGDIDLNAFGANGDIYIKAGDKAIIAGNGSSYATQPAGTTMVYNQNDDVLINASGGEIKIGGAYGNRPTGVDIGPTDGDIDIWAFSAGSKINLTGTGGIDSLSVHNFQFDNGITLAGIAGVAGEVIASAGPGAPLAWSTVSSLLHLTTSNVFTGDATNTPTATDLIKLDLAPAATFPDITIGKTGPITLTHTLGLYYAAVTHPLGDLNLSYGFDALVQSPLTGTLNTALGIGALQEVVAGSYNTGVGHSAGAGTQDTAHNTALGFNALKGVAPNTVGNYNVAIGSKSMEFMNSNVADSNTAVGTLSLGALSTGKGNVAIGYDAGFGITTGTANIAIGRDSMLTASVNASENVVIGDTTGQNITSDENAIIGASAGNTLVNGQKNVLVGHSADVSANADSDAVAIGANSTAGGASIAIGSLSNAAQDGIALGGRATATAPHSIALGNLSAAPNLQTININVVGGVAPVLQGGLVTAPIGAPLPPPPLTGGDVYVVSGVMLPGSANPCNVLCIV